MARERKRRRGAGTGWLAWLGLLILAALFLRALGPGGLRPRELLGLQPPPPAPSPMPAPAPAPAPAETPAPADSPRPGPAALRGTVSTSDGNPAGGASVEAIFAVPGEPLPVTRTAGPTGPDGSFEVKDPPAAWTGLRLRARRGPLSVEADLEEASGAGDLRLDLRLPATFAVSGILVSAEEGRPLPDMKVAWGPRETRSDRLGRFSFPDLPASLLSGDLPPLEVSGAGRKPLSRPLPADATWDDLLIRVGAE